MIINEMRLDNTRFKFLMKKGKDFPIVNKIFSPSFSLA